MVSLADLLYNRFEQRGAISDLDEALALTRNALELRTQGHPDRATLLGNIAFYLYSRFEQLETLSDLNEALALARNALELCPQGHPDRAASLGNIALYLHSRFEQTGSLSDLDEALALARNALELRPQGHPDRAALLYDIALYLHSRFKQLGTLSDLDEALALARNALELYPKRHPDRASSLRNLANSLHSRFKQIGTLSDLNEALALERNVLELCPQGHSDRATSLGNIALYLHSRFKQLGALSDLDEALALARSALELCPQGNPGRATSLGNIALYLHSRFKQIGTISDLDEALALARDALELRPQGHPDRASSLRNLANSLHSRFKQIGTISDLDEALALARNALELCPQGHPGRATSLGNIALYLHTRFEQLGTLSELDEALAVQRNVLELLPQGHPGRATSLSRLASSLHTRFEQLGTLSDLDEALALARNALELRPQGHPDRATSLGNIAFYLHARFKQLGTLSDLDEALAVQRSVLGLRLQGHPGQATSLGNIALYLHSRFEQLGTLSDLEEALALERNVLELRPQGHPLRAHSLSNLGSYLHARFKQLGTLSDLEDALALERSALELRTQGHPHRATSLSKIASYLRARFKHSTMHDISDLQETFNLYSQLSDVSHTVSFADLDCAKRWIQAAEKCGHTTTVLAYQTFLRFSVQHFATLPSLPRHLALLKQLMTSKAVDAFSACLRYGNPANAVELLEHGRGVFWSQLIRLRSPLDKVIASGDKGEKLADKFRRLASLLRSVLDVSPDAESQHDQAFRLNIQLQDTVTEIRKLPGLSRFLLPTLFSDLQIAASGGPVIIVNASQYSCDALIVLPDRDPVHVALPITKSRVSKLALELRSLTLRAEFDDMTKEFLTFLRELWDIVVFPIVTTLQEFSPRRSRIWWCPTAEFSLLPLHAAGSFRKGQPTLPDLYISSYTPTLTALLRARQTRPLDPSMDQHRFLVVGQAQAPGQCELVSVNTELSGISQRIGSVATLTRVQDQDATMAKVAEELQKNEFVHLACHGIPDPKQPFESGFALGDELLKVEDIMRYELQNAQFTYLSACHTTVGDEESPDEVIHLAAAMQFAGFRSVIGTMWAVDDGHTNEITSKFYEYMVDESGRLDHTRSALALHRTMNSLRLSKIPVDQRILYIHMGA
jgi:CHAT domain-containing protein